MAEITDRSTIEENVQNPEKKVAQIEETDASQGKVVEQGDNASGGVSPFQAELSRVEELFSNEKNGRSRGSSPEEGIKKGINLSINSDKPIGYNRGEVTALDGKKSVQDSGYWLNVRSEGVPV